MAAPGIVAVMGENVVGEQLRRLREKAGLTQEVAAGLAGITPGYLSMLERGKRALNGRYLIQRLAAVYRVSPAALRDLGSPGALDVPGDPLISAHIDGVRAAMQAVVIGVPGGDILPVDQLRVRAHTVLASAQALRIAETGALLPALIRDIHTTLSAGQDTHEVLRIVTLVWVKAVASWLCAVSAPPDLVWQAQCQAQTLANESGEAVPLGIATFGVANTLLCSAEIDLAGVALSNCATRTGDDRLDGMLALTRALWAASARTGDADEALQEAADIAARTGDGNAYYMAFGPSNVDVWRVSLALEQEDFDLAARLTGNVTVTMLPPSAVSPPCSVERAPTRR